MASKCWIPDQVGNDRKGIMDIRIENQQVVIELNDLEFEAFETMFNKLNDNHSVYLVGRDWPAWSIHGGSYSQPLLPMHLCRCIGEACAVEQAGPLDLMSLYPFWKYGFCFGDGTDIRLNFTEIDPHKKANLSDEFGMGFCAWAMEEIFDCESWCDTADALDKGTVEVLGLSRPDFVCTFKDGSLGFFEAKGTTQGRSQANSQGNEGKYQTSQIEPVSGIVRVRCCMAVSLEKDDSGVTTRLLIQDPPASENVVKVDITPERIREAARARGYREKLFGDITALFECGDRKLSLKRTPYVAEKRHGWLEVV